MYVGDARDPDRVRLTTSAAAVPAMRAPVSLRIIASVCPFLILLPGAVGRASNQCFRRVDRNQIPKFTFVQFLRNKLRAAASCDWADQP